MAESKLKIDPKEETFKPFKDQEEPEAKENKPEPKVKKTSTLRKMAKFKEIKK